MTIYVGLDIAKSSFQIYLKDENGEFQENIKNDFHGFKLLKKRLSNYSDVHICCEYTGIYYFNLALDLFNSGYKISVVNPYIIKCYSNQKMLRNKTDAVDAKLLAQYCEHFQPDLWQPADIEIREISALSARIEQLIKIRSAEKNREKVSNGKSLISIQETISFLDRQILQLENDLDKIISKSNSLLNKRNLLVTVPGIGKKTANILLPIFSQIERFDNSKKMVSYLGLSPMIYQSGSSVHRKSCISKKGNSFIRKSLFLPARVACLRSNIFRDWAQSHFLKGKAPKVVYSIMMRKLVVFCYSVIKNNQLFEYKVK